MPRSCISNTLALWTTRYLHWRQQRRLVRQWRRLQRRDRLRALLLLPMRRQAHRSLAAYVAAAGAKMASPPAAPKRWKRIAQRIANASARLTTRFLPRPSPQQLRERQARHQLQQRLRLLGHLSRLLRLLRWFLGRARN